ncbi:melanoma inhibitory activity protein 2 isoform 2-T2 [Rhinophrynus dorsalis]
MDTLQWVMSSLPDNLQPGSHLFGCSWEVVVFIGLFVFPTVLLFICRAVRSIRSKSYAGRERKLGEGVAEALTNKSAVLEKLSIVQKQYEDLQRLLEDSDHQKLLTETSEHKSLQESLQKSNSSLEEKIRRLEEDLEEERRLGIALENQLGEFNEKIKSLEENLSKGSSQKDEVRTTLKVFEINQGRLETSLQDTAEEKAHLQESVKQLSKEAEGWEERLSELTDNSKILSSSVDVMQEDLNLKQSQITMLIDNLLTLKDWSAEVDDANDVDDLSVPNMKWDFENGEPLGDPQRRRIKKLIFAAMLNASLRSAECEKQQLCDNLSDELKAKELLSECIKNLQNTKQSLSSEKQNLEREVENLKQKISVMSEMYQENEQKLHRKLTVQEKERIQKEEKLSKVAEKISLTTGELHTVKTRVQELEEEIDKTVCSYQNQVTTYEKKSHDNWLTARAAERYLSDVKKETAHLRQKLTEAEYKLELVERDPFALDVIQAIGRESSPYGLSPVNRLPESRAFLSPPTLLDGPLRLSPMLPGPDRGIRPPGYYPAYPGPKEHEDVNADRKPDHHRTLSDSGSLSPPWEREHKSNLPPSGVPFLEPPFPPRRPEQFYHYPVPSGRFSGPAELTRNQGKPFMDASDGRSSPEYRERANTSRTGSEENFNFHGQLPPREVERGDGPPRGYPAPPPARVPLLPMNLRGPYFRRPFPTPPPPMEMYGLAPNYPGMAPLHAPRRSPVPPQHFVPPFVMYGEPQSRSEQLLDTVSSGSQVTDGNLDSET